MASWRDKILGRGKFRGVPFYFDKVDGEIGRRSVLKEFPGRDTPLVEDNGRATRRFTIEMFVLGDDYMGDRDSLREALEAPGPGELEHPYWGTMQVTLDGKAHVTESTKQGGMAKFTASFIEAGDDLKHGGFDFTGADTGLQVVSNAEKLTAAAESRFAKVFATVGAIQAVADDAVAKINSVASAVNSVRGKIAASLQVVNDAAAAITAVTDNVAALILTPTTLATTLTNMISTVVSGITHIGEAFDTVAEFFGSEEALPAEGNILAARSRVEVLDRTAHDLATVADFAPASDGTAQQEEIKRNNQNAIAQLSNAIVITACSTVAAELDFESYDQAAATRQALTDLIDDMLLTDGLTDELYEPLTNLRASICEHLSNVAATLPEVEDFVPNGTIPALVLAYRLYGDHKREAEILARNPQIRDPSAVPGGAILKVLRDPE